MNNELQLPQNVKNSSSAEVENIDSPEIVVKDSNQDKNPNNHRSHKIHPRHHHLIGLSLALLSTFCFSITLVITKYLIRAEYRIIHLFLWRSLGILFPSIALTLYYNTKFNIFSPIYPWTRILAKTRNNAIILILRTTAGSTGILLQFWALEYLHIADVTIISNSTPILVAILAWQFLNEKCGIISMLAPFIAVVGVLILAKPPLLTGDEEFSADTMIGLGLSIASMALTAITSILLRKVNTIHWALNGVALGFIPCLQYLILILCSLDSVQIPSGVSHWCLAIALGITTFSATALLTKSFEYEEAGPISLIRTIEVVFAFFWQWILFQVLPDLYSFIGGVLVILAVMLIAGRNCFQQ